jgi:hypothetical protein
MATMVFPLPEVWRQGWFASGFWRTTIARSNTGTMKSYADQEANAGNGKWIAIAFLNQCRFRQALGNCQAGRAAQA